MANEFQIQGLDPVLDKLRTVSREIAQKGARAAGTRAMRIVRDAARAKARALDDPQSKQSVIAKNVTTRFDSKGSKRQSAIVVKVGVAGGAKPMPGREDTGHWRLLEFGTSTAQAQPFMRTALSENVEAVTAAFVEELVPQIDKALAKAKR